LKFAVIHQTGQSERTARPAAQYRFLRDVFSNRDQEAVELTPFEKSIVETSGSSSRRNMISSMMVGLKFKRTPYS